MNVHSKVSLVVSIVSHSRYSMFGYCNVPIYGAEMFAERSQSLPKYRNVKACMPVASYHAILRLKTEGMAEVSRGKRRSVGLP